jgi:hypothetical protein
MKIERALLTAATALTLCLSLITVAQAATVTVLYKRSSEQSVQRTDTAVQAALVSFERELIERGVEVIQPDAKTYAVLDKAPDTIVTFSADAGLSLLVDAVKTSRPNPGTDNAFAEVRLRARLFHGRRILSALAGSGQVGYRLGSEDKAYEVAADRAVKKLVDAVMAKLEQAPPVTAAASVETVPDVSVTPLPKPAKTWGLLMGVANFANVRKLNPGFGIADLDGVKGDIALIKKTLNELKVPDNQLKVLSDAGATTAALRAGLNELVGKTGPDDLVVLYIASHGMPKQEGISGFGYPVTFDTRMSDKNSIIDFEEIQGILKALPSRRVLWIADTCHSGGATIGLPVVEISSRNIRISKAATGLSTKAATSGLEEKDLAVLSSARDEQVALEDGANGLFTLKLAAALRQSNGESVYRIFKKHLEAQVPERSRQLSPGYSQQPAFARSGKGDAISF